MIGLLVILAVSWILLRYLSSENLKTLGYLPVLKRVGQFIKGLVFGLLLVTFIIFAEAMLRGTQWGVSPDISGLEILLAVSYHLKSALTEDLIFRGALLYLLMSKTKPWIGMLVSAIAFGVYHWFSYGILNERIIVLVYVLVTTGLMGLVWGYTYYKTKSVALGWGLHSGGNIATTCLLVSQPYGEILLSASGGITFSDGAESLINIAKGLLPPLLTYIYLRFAYKKTETSH